MCAQLLDNAAAHFEQPFTMTRAFFSVDDYAWVVREARRLDTRGLEQERRKIQRDFDARMVAEKQAANAKKQRKADAIQMRLDATPFISSVDEIAGLAGARVDDQLEKMRRLWNPDKKNPRLVIKLVSHLPLVADKRAELTRVFPLHVAMLEGELGPGALGGLFSDDEMSADEDFWEEEDRGMEEVE
jgi:hypothetical protein